jgi:hypothetical protein
MPSERSDHIYYDECSVFGVFKWKVNLSIELGIRDNDGQLHTHVLMAANKIDGTNGLMVDVSGKGRRFVSDTQSVRCVKRYVDEVVRDGRVDPRESRILKHMALDMLDGMLDGNAGDASMSDLEYRRALRRLKVV